MLASRRADSLLKALRKAFVTRWYERFPPYRYVFWHNIEPVLRLVESPPRIVPQRTLAASVALIEPLGCWRPFLNPCLSRGASLS